LEGFHVPAIQGAYSSCARDSLRVKCVGALGVIAMRQGDIENNKVSTGLKKEKQKTTRKFFATCEF
jgi:hypothetical protein